MRQEDDELVLEILFRSLQAHDSLDSTFSQRDLSGFRAYYEKEVPQLERLRTAIGERLGRSDGTFSIQECKQILSLLDDLLAMIRTSSNPDRSCLVRLRVGFYELSQLCRGKLGRRQRFRLDRMLDTRRVPAYLCTSDHVVTAEEFLDRKQGT